MYLNLMRKKISLDIEESLLANIVKAQGTKMKKTGKMVHLTDMIIETLEEKFSTSK